jgi:hypothetical protein
VMDFELQRSVQGLRSSDRDSEAGEGEKESHSRRSDSAVRRRMFLPRRAFPQTDQDPDIQYFTDRLGLGTQSKGGVHLRWLERLDEPACARPPSPYELSRGW